MRVFCALPVPDPPRRALADAGRSLKALCRELSVPAEEGLHFTLFYFGEVDEPGVERLKRIVASPALEFQAVRTAFSGLGSFPHRGNPRVIFAALGKGSREVTAFQERLGRLLLAHAWPLEDEKRPFHPHLTLARNKGALFPVERWTSLPLPQEEFLLDRCVLFQSILKPAGAVYRPLAERLFTA